MHYLYKITNQLNGKIYIGQSKNDQYRWRQHLYFAKNPEKTGQYIHRAMNKYGTNNFIFEIIATCKTQEDANETENVLIIQYSSRNGQYGYNLTVGGSHGGHSEETRQKLREATINQIATKGHPAQGHKWTDEQKNKLSQTLKDLDKEQIYTPEVRQRMSDAHIGKKQPPELVKKRSDAIRSNKGVMVCAAPGCGEIKNRSSITIDGFRYCDKHAARLKTTGILELRPRKAHNKKQFTNEDVNKILADKRSAEVIGKDYSVSETVIFRIRRENT